MNPIEMLQDKLARRFPDFPVEIDSPADPAGPWYLDIRPGASRPFIVVEWKPGHGFGISTPESSDYGMKPDELYAEANAAFDRVIQLILSGGQTRTPGVFQIEQAKLRHRLSNAPQKNWVGQAELSMDEGREAMRLDTLYRVASALGGRLSIRIQFADGTERELTDLADLAGVSAPSEDVDQSIP
jgi:hypothetical protein